MVQVSAYTPAIGSVTRATNSDVPERPRLAPQVSLSGELRGTGFRDRQWLIQRNGRFLQVTELLYRIAEHADGQRTIDELAVSVSTVMDRLVSPEQIHHLLNTSLVPNGVVATANAAHVLHISRPRRSPLAVNMRLRLVGPRVLEPIARVLQVLYAPPIAIPMVLAIVAAHGWLYFSHGLAVPLRAALFTPGGLFLLLALLLVSSFFHELGHAAALRYGGGQVRGMGAGIYIVYPVLYTDVTDSYRLGRWARLRTDLGGFYFHLIFALGMTVAAQATGWELLLFGVPLIDLAILRQCLPFVRFDGYWVVTDLTGIPDFFASIGPFVVSLLPKRHARRAMPELKTHIKVVFAVYLALTIPLLATLYLLMMRGLPSFIATTVDATRLQAIITRGAWSTGDFLQASASTTQIAFLVVPVIGMGYVVYATARRVWRLIWKWSKPTPLRRTAGATLAGGVATFLALVWMPQFASVLPVEPVGVQHFSITDRSHVSGSVSYAQDPPVGGPHAPIWLNCGFYSATVPAEYAVHSLEHGAVWITYRPDLASDQVAALRQLAHSHGYVIVSAYPDLRAPLVASAWGVQLVMDSASDTRLTQFVRAFERSPQAPEPTQPCRGGIGTPQ